MSVHLSYAVATGDSTIIAAVIAGVFMTVNSVLTIWLTRRRRGDDDDDK
jgi:lipid-A-disaccharide synthase-like uncharacterized protein